MSATIFPPNCTFCGHADHGEVCEGRIVIGRTVRGKVPASAPCPCKRGVLNKDVR